MITRVNHIGIVVKDIEQALIPYREALGLRATDIEYIEDFNVRVVFIPVGDTRIELVQPVGESGELIDFIEKTGGGLHHIALEVDKIDQTLRDTESFGIPLKDKVPRPGAHNTIVAFARPEGFDNALMEFVQPLQKSEEA
jgi:methylmalonyl-CoA epimerase